jgi:hypothetical protein
LPHALAPNAIHIVSAVAITLFALLFLIFPLLFCYYPFTAPEIREVCLKDEMINSSFTFIDYFRIPNKKDESVTIRFYIRFGQEAKNEFQNQSFSIGRVSFLTI